MAVQVNQNSLNRPTSSTCPGSHINRQHLPFSASVSPDFYTKQRDPFGISTRVPNDVGDHAHISSYSRVCHGDYASGHIG